MPGNETNDSISPSLDLNINTVVCPQSSIPSSRGHGTQRMNDDASFANSTTSPTMSPPVSDNTASGMSMMQEDSMYTFADTTPSAMHVERADGHRIHESIEDASDGNTATKSVPFQDGTDVSERGGTRCVSTDAATGRAVLGAQIMEHISIQGHGSPSIDLAANHFRTPSPDSKDNDRRLSRSAQKRPSESPRNPGLASIDMEMNKSAGTKCWEFSRQPLLAQYPSSLFQTNSKFKGTQQSDKHVYNVEVTILTVDIDQSTMSGYLQICELTPDHPTLTTFFTGEIIGGPEQKYGFRTSDPLWGASDKTDVTHWARFPAWRTLSSHARKNINFTYPLDQSPWWQQENIFMRWKEHFLVPDYKLKSIQGASFEGFYYICLNQVEGRISGIYFHSKSEKYQQLELKHDGQQGVWGMGVCPSVEFR